MLSEDNAMLTVPVAHGSIYFFINCISLLIKNSTDSFVHY